MMNKESFAQRWGLKVLGFWLAVGAVWIGGVWLVVHELGF